jgi:phosphoserine aminotransferase
LGNGYGKWKNSTFRIANFPAIEEFEITKLKEILMSDW